MNTDKLSANCIDPLFGIKGCDMPKGSCKLCQPTHTDKQPQTVIQWIKHSDIPIPDDYNGEVRLYDGYTYKYADYNKLYTSNLNNWEWCNRYENVLLYTPEELQALKAEWQREQWISVDSRLPEIEDKPFANIKVLAVTNGYVKELTYRRDEVRGKILYRWHGAYGLVGSAVTHWMPLPPSPKS